jgi:hypothetical protein
MNNQRIDIEWARENPKRIKEQHMKSPSLCIWCGMYSGGIIGPYIFPDTCDGAAYLDMLENTIYPILVQEGIADTIIWQQDGAPAHWSLEVRQWLSIKFPGRWIGRGGGPGAAQPWIPWPQRCPDLTPPDFFLWGYLKHKIYSDAPKTMAELKEKLHEHLEAIPLDMVRKACRTVRGRYEECIRQRGAHIVFTHG